MSRFNQETGMISMKTILAALIVVFSLGAVQTASAACQSKKCPPSAALEAVGQRIAEECGCDPNDKSSRKPYAKCVQNVTKAAKADGTLTGPCAAAARKCALVSTCGKPGKVVCCQQKRNGSEKASIAPQAKCEKKGVACLAFTSAFDGCDGSGNCATTTSTSTSSTSSSSTSSTMSTPTTTSSSTTTATIFEGCGNGVREDPPETCDDNNNDDDDACPADCIIDACDPNVGTDFTATVSFASPGSQSLGALEIVVDYPEGKVVIPGVADVSGSVDELASGTFIQNDQEHNLKTAYLASSPFGAAPGQLQRIHFETCGGQNAPTAGEFGCKVLSAGAPLTAPEPGAPVAGVTCSISLP